ncbi:MAG TPA: hypothetical protein PKO06_10975, partial [Candidatus Ozemobacteraceae bacterium]|nr:hypothetical protein [Candidatus Ozemobacteraceae bacterium]
SLSTAQAAIHTVIGQIESVYMNRASMTILDTRTASDTPETLSVGKFVSFNLPAQGGKKKTSVQYGNIVEVDLAGDIATEYGGQVASDATKVFIWTAVRCDKVKNAKKYTSGKDGEKKGKGKGKGKKKDEIPDRLWTQEEAVRGTISYREKDKKLYIREQGLRPRDKGLDVVTDEWFEKLKPFNGQQVVVHGTTHRTSLASGTIEIDNILRVYPK